MENNEGLEIALTPIQLAAILEGETLEESDCLTNRIWGAVTLAASAVELIGATVLMLTPEPTTVTKIAGGALGSRFGHCVNGTYANSVMPYPHYLDFSSRDCCSPSPCNSTWIN